MRKFKNYFHDQLNYLREKEIKPESWYEIRDNLQKWYVMSFVDDTIGMDMLVEYTKKVQKIQKPHLFFENMVNLVLFAKLSEKEKKLVYNIAKKTFMDGLLHFEKDYILELIEKEFLEKCIEENILIEDDEKFKFQNILLQTYLAAYQINKEKIEINDELFKNWIENEEYEYSDYQIQVLYIFYILNIERFNKQYLKPKLDEFLAKIDTTDNLHIVQSIIDIYQIAEKYEEECVELLTSTDDDYQFIKFLGLDIEGVVIDKNYDDSDSLIRMRYMDEEGNITIDYTKVKEDKILMKILDEEGVVDELLQDYQYLKKLAKKIEKNPKEDYCNNWEIKNSKVY